jgi:transcription termination factor Rho
MISSNNSHDTVTNDPGPKRMRNKRQPEEAPGAAAEAEPTSGARRTARKTASKTAAKPTRRKSVGKATAPEDAPASVETVADPPPAPVVDSSAPVGEPTPGEPKRFGRVPGGGPVVAREPANAVVEPSSAPGNHHPQEGRNHKRRRDKRKWRGDRQPNGFHSDGESNGESFAPRGPIELAGPKTECNGMLEIAPKGFGFLRVPEKRFEMARDDVFVSPETIRKSGLRVGQWIHGLYQVGPRGPQLVEITAVNDLPPAEAVMLPHFDELKAINPNKRISFETTPERFTTRVVDIMAPVGRGQRGLIVSPPRSGKTTLLLHMAEAIREKYDEAIHLMVLLVDERPEEVTEFRRALPGAEIYASSNDEQPRNHCRIAELAIERAKRLVEAGKDVFLLMDSITRLARAYNNTMGSRGRATGSGGITIGALEIPRRLFAAARNTRGGGSLTILATALIQTNSRADEAIFMEFKGTGNMELVLDRRIAESYIYPAVDIFRSGTRREELLLPGHMLHKIHLIRRGLAGHRPLEAMERLLFFLKKFPNNPQMLLEIKG